MKTIRQLLPQRKPTDNKSAGGKCLIIGGSKGMTGALVLAATAASRVGAGYVYVYSDNDKAQIPPDFLTLQAVAIDNFTFFSSIAIGCGLKNTLKNKIFLEMLIESHHPRVVLDAGALEILSQMKIKKLPSTWIITPHEKEISRLISMTTKEVKEDRTRAITEAFNKYRCLVLLKGHHSLIRYQSKMLIIQTGNSALAKAGTGDVLTGMIAGFLSQKLNCLNATYLAATVHGLIADEWVKSKDHLSIMPSDLNNLIPEVLFKLRNH